MALVENFSRLIFGSASYLLAEMWPFFSFVSVLECDISWHNRFEKRHKSAIYYLLGKRNKSFSTKVSPEQIKRDEL